MVKTFQLTAVGSALMALSGMVFAQTADQPLQVWGKVNTQMESIEAKGGTPAGDDKPQRWRVSNVSSELGFKRSFDLGDGLTATAQYVTGINSDGGSSMLGSAKDVFIALSGKDVGALKLGRLTAASRWNSGTSDFSPAGAGPQDDQAMQAKMGGLTAAGAVFNDRFDNAIGFESASWSGVSVRAYYSANEGTSNSTPASGTGLTDDAYSIGLNYVAGPWDIRLSTEQRNDKGTLNNTNNRKTQDKDYKLGVRYALSSATTIGFTFDNQVYTDNNATGVQKAKLSRNGWVLGFGHKMDKHTIYGGYGVADVATGELANGSVFDGANTGAKQFALGYTYQFNKQVMWETFISQVRNDSAAKYDFDGGGISQAGLGATVTAVGAGLRIEF